MTSFEKIITNIKSTLNNVKSASQSPLAYLANHLSDIRNEIDIDCELIRQKAADIQKGTQVDKIQPLFIDEVNKFEQSCLSQQKIDQLEDELLNNVKDSIRSIEADLECIDSNDKFTAILNDELINEILRKIEERLFNGRSIMYLKFAALRVIEEEVFDGVEVDCGEDSEEGSYLDDSDRDDNSEDNYCLCSLGYPGHRPR